MFAIPAVRLVTYMNSTLVISIILLLAIALFGGSFIARKSDKAEKVRGGVVGRVSHFLASAIMIAVAPTVLCNVFFLHPEFLGQINLLGLNLTPLVHAVVIAAVLIVIALALLMIHAAAARPELDGLVPDEDRGWTAEDAKKSGL